MTEVLVKQSLPLPGSIWGHYNTMGAVPLYGASTTLCGQYKTIGTVQPYVGSTILQEQYNTMESVQKYRTIIGFKNVGQYNTAGAPQ